MAVVSDPTPIENKPFGISSQQEETSDVKKVLIPWQISFPLESKTLNKKILMAKRLLQSICLWYTSSSMALSFLEISGMWAFRPFLGGSAHDFQLLHESPGGANNPFLVILIPNILLILILIRNPILVLILSTFILCIGMKKAMLVGFTELSNWHAGNISNNKSPRRYADSSTHVNLVDTGDVVLKVSCLKPEVRLV